MKKTIVIALTILNYGCATAPTDIVPMSESKQSFVVKYPIDILDVQVMDGTYKYRFTKGNNDYYMSNNGGYVRGKLHGHTISNTVFIEQGSSNVCVDGLFFIEYCSDEKVTILIEND